MKGRSLVLLVDDNDAGHLLVRALLQSAGLKVDSSGSAVEALKRMSNSVSLPLTRNRPGADRVA